MSYKVKSQQRAKRSRNTKPRPWKQNVLRVPNNILAQVAKFKNDSLVASCAKKLSVTDIEAGLYEHLGLRYDDGKLVVPQQVVPPLWIGKYSRWNREPREIVHRDEPMKYVSWGIDSPNWGDWSKGTHTVTVSKLSYPRTYEAPKLVPIKIELLVEEIREGTPVLRFTVDEVLDRRASDFLDALLFNINLLQENVGTHNVFETEATRDEYLKTLFVNWEILPAGEQEDTLERILSGLRSSDPNVRAQISERYEFLRQLKPVNFIRGTNGFRNYFGALFADDLVVFENVEYGNAIYVMYENWAELSQKSRLELLALSDRNYRHRSL